MGDKEIAVRVALRARPLVLKEIHEGAQDILRFVPNEPQVVIGQNKAFTFDFVFPGDSKQDALYNNAISDRIDCLFKGYNVTVLAYGQTGSGKTYTMGTAYSAAEACSEANNGVIQRAVYDIFKGIEERSSTTEFIIKVSFLEVYNEDVSDLLQKNNNCPISIREDQDGIKIIGLTEQHVTSPEETFQALELGSRSRTTASTNMNARSSRSHAIFTVILEQRSLENCNDITIAKFHLVDLAGSERAHKTGALGDRFKEGVNINKGLLALGNVISSLCDNNSHIPYRDSKLTRLLQDSLGGNSHTIMIACVSPADSNFDETINTLRYADRARKIKNKPVINIDSRNFELAQLRRQVQMLQDQLLQQQSTFSKDVCAVDKQNNDNLNTLYRRNKFLETENKRLARELQHSLNQTSTLCEKALMAEMANEQLIEKFEEIQQQTNDIIEKLLTISNDNPELQEQLHLLQEYQSKIIEIKRGHLKKDKEFSVFSPMKKHKLDESTAVSQDFEKSPCYEGKYSPIQTSEDEELDLESTLKQAQMSRDLEELEKALAIKEELASKMQESDSQMTVMRIHYENNMKEMEQEIAVLQKEKEELLNALKVVQTNVNIGKLSEQRRKRLQELELKITEMKKQIQEKSRLLKIKQDAEKKVNNLQNEIQVMKANRVKLLRQIKVESEKYKQKIMTKDKEVANLKKEDRKRQFQMSKLQQEFDKQKIVLKRKMEEALAANRRLNDAMQLQRNVAERRAKEKQQSILGIGTRVQQWLSQEIEVVLRSKEAHHHKEILLADRKTINEQIRMYEKDLESLEPPEKKKSGSNSDEESQIEIKQRIKALEEELEIRNVQISDLNQKLLDADQDEKNKQRWDSIQSMTEAKCAMKWLFENVVAARFESFLQSFNNKNQIDTLKNEINHYKTQFQTASDDRNKVLEMMRGLKVQHEQQIAKLIRENEDKTIYFLKQLNSSRNSNNTSVDENNSLVERIRFQEVEINRLSYLNEELQKKNSEIDELKEKLASVHKGNRPKLLSKLNDNMLSYSKPKEVSSSLIQEFLDGNFTETESESENDENDPLFRGTPMYKRTKNKLQKSASDPAAYEQKKRMGNSSLTGCNCKISCGSRRCGCNKQAKSCSEFCRCKKEFCCNRDLNTKELKPSLNTTYVNEKQINSQNVEATSDTVSMEEVDQNDSDEFFICPVSLSDPKKHSSEDIVNDSGVQHFRRKSSQRYFAPVAN